MARYVTVVAVSILAIAICLVFFAYLAFNDKESSAKDAAEYADADSLRMIALVSVPSGSTLGIGYVFSALLINISNKL